MAKPIKLTIAVEEIALGKVWTTLDGMPGVISIAFHGNGPKKSEPKPRGKNGGSATVPCLILGALAASKGPLPKNILVDAVVEGGRSASSTQDSLSKLKKEKCIVPAGKGIFKITPAGVKRYETACEVE